MTKIFVFIVGNNDGYDKFETRLFISCAVTDKGKLLAGSVSQSADRALAGCAAMSKEKAKTQLSGESEIVLTEYGNPELHAAMKRLLERKP